MLSGGLSSLDSHSGEMLPDLDCTNTSNPSAHFTPESDSAHQRDGENSQVILNEGKDKNLDHSWKSYVPKQLTSSKNDIPTYNSNNDNRSSDKPTVNTPDSSSSPSPSPPSSPRLNRRDYPKTRHQSLERKKKDPERNCKSHSQEEPLKDKIKRQRDKENPEKKPTFVITRDKEDMSGEDHSKEEGEDGIKKQRKKKSNSFKDIIRREDREHN